jgi:hypothetical protein
MGKIIFIISQDLSTVIKFNLISVMAENMLNDRHTLHGPNYNYSLAKIIVNRKRKVERL